MYKIKGISLKKLNRLVGEEPEYSYFYQIPGEDSDITTLFNYELR